MKTFIMSAILISVVTGAVSAQTARDDTLRSIALRVSELETQRQLPSATPATIDSLLALYADDVVYEHPNAGAVIRGKDLMRRNMAQYIGSIRTARTQPPSVTVGHGVAVVETHADVEVEDGGKWIRVARHGLRVIEFNPQGLVRRIIDYPW